MKNLAGAWSLIGLAGISFGLLFSIFTKADSTIITLYVIGFGALNYGSSLRNRH